MRKIFQSIKRYPVSTGLNVMSLIIAFSGIITLLLYISFENSFDKHNENYDTVYKIQVGSDGGTVPAIMSKVIKRDVPEVVAITPMWFNNSLFSLPKNNDKSKFYSKSMMYVNNDVFDIFTFDFILGNKENALTKPNTVVLTESLSKTLFGDINPIGKEVSIDYQLYTCTGVIKDLPKTSSFYTDCLLSFETLLQQENSWVDKWSEWSFVIFAKLNKNETPENIIPKLNGIKEIEERYKDEGEATLDDFFYLLPLKDLHFTNTGMFSYANPTVLNVLYLLAFILAIMGIVNFINLLTSQAMQRAKSFTIKRVLGASRLNMTSQIIIESVFISLFALLVALIIHNLFFQSIEDILQIDGLSFTDRDYWYLYFIALAIIYGFVASLYPARYITSTQITQSIKGVMKFSGKGKRIRNVLLVLQFSFTIMLIIGAITINKQIFFWHNFDTGINTESIVYLNTTRNIKDHSEAFAKDLLKDKNITDYTYSSFVPGAVWMKWGRTINEQNISITCWPIDERFFDFFDIEITEGRKFSENIEADKDKFILNEAAVKEFNWDKPLEKIMPGFDFEGEIIGVAKDFNFSSLKEKIQPMQFWLTNERNYVIMLKISNGNITESIKHIENTWNNFEKEATFDYKFLDEKLQAQYSREEGIAYFIEFVALWSILLSITGLLGLALFVARQRTKEIGIRRANGASIKEILLMLNYDFIKWIVIAFIIAVPVAYYAVNKWLENFAYRTELSWWVFALAGVFTLFISVLAVSVQTFRVARKNPVEALRYE